MTIQLQKGDRVYKIIEAKTFGTERKRFISKIDQNKKITILTYIFGMDDVKIDRTIDPENKRMVLLIKDITEEQFKHVININYKIYPEFEIILEKDYSDKTLEDAIELMNIEASIRTNVPIKTILDEIRNNKI